MRGFCEAAVAGGFAREDVCEGVGCYERCGEVAEEGEGAGRVGVQGGGGERHVDVVEGEEGRGGV